VPTSVELTEIDVSIKSKRECNFKFENVPKEKYEYNLPFKLQNHQFCAGSVDENVRTNPGDSGGPVFIRRWSESGEHFDWDCVWEI